MRVLKWFKTTSTPTKPDAHTSPRCRHLCDIITGAKAVQTACGNAPPDRAWAFPRRFTGYKAPFPPNLRLATSFLSIVPVNSPNGPPPFLTALLAGPGWPRLAPVSGAPLASCGAASKPLQSPFCLRLAHHVPQPRALIRPPFGTLSRRRPSTDGDHDGVPEPFQSTSRLPTRFPLGTVPRRCHVSTVDPISPIHSSHGMYDPLPTNHPWPVQVIQQQLLWSAPL